MCELPQSPDRLGTKLQKFEVIDRSIRVCGGVDS